MPSELPRTFLRKYALPTALALVWPFVFKAATYVATQLWEDWLVQAVHWMYGRYLLEYVAVAIDWYGRASLSSYAAIVVLVALVVWVVSAIDTSLVARRHYVITPSAPPTTTRIETIRHDPRTPFERMKDRLAKEYRDKLEAQKLLAEKELAEEQLRLLRDQRSRITLNTDPPPRERMASRRLTSAHMEPMIRMLRGEIQKLSMPKPPRIAIMSIGMERETLDYRNDFVKVFEAAGFGVQTQEWGAAVPEHEIFTDGVTLLQLSNDATNGVRPIVLRALLSAGIVPREEPYPDVKPRNRPNVAARVGILVNWPEATLVIGQRRFN